MKVIEVNIATLKARLSEFLKKVKTGSDVLILDRKYPIARITQLTENDKDDVKLARPIDPRPVGQFNFPKFSMKLTVNSTDLLRAERKKR